MNEYKVNLVYFKKTGKFYADGFYFTTKTEMYDIWDEDRKMESFPGNNDW